MAQINNKKELENKFIDNMRSMTASLTQSINKIAQINTKKELENKFVDSMRSMIASLTQSINKISQIDQKIAQSDKKEPEKIRL